jgi:catechol 2,3-dioxygenase-like lactoylglutathione lyase family enzyme
MSKIEAPPNTIAVRHVHLWVDDQDEALAFYRDKVGMELRADGTLPEAGDYRWLTVGPPGQPDLEIVLDAIPGPPVLTAETSEQIRDLMAKGWGSTVFLSTGDCRAAYEELRGRGIDFVEEPTERPYGIDCYFRDPSGNPIRLMELRTPE